MILAGGWACVAQCVGLLAIVDYWTAIDRVDRLFYNCTQTQNIE
jgi:hypothetical protein